MKTNNEPRFSKEEWEDIVKDCTSIADICRKCGWVAAGGNYRTVHHYLKLYDTDTSHFLGRRNNLGNPRDYHHRTLDELLQKDTRVSSSLIKSRLFKEGIKKYECEICGTSEWLGKPITLQLHHINGDNTDNRLENLQILCPNCHTQTENFCHKKIKDEPRRCCDCGEILLDKNSIRCKKCSSIQNGLKSRKVERPDKETLEKLIQTLSFLEIGRQYNVSDNAVRKWCKSYGLPYKKQDIKAKTQ